MAMFRARETFIINPGDGVDIQIHQGSAYSDEGAIGRIIARFPDRFEAEEGVTAAQAKRRGGRRPQGSGE